VVQPASASLAFAAALVIGVGCGTQRRDGLPKGVSLPKGSSCGSFVIPQGGYEPAEFRVQQECLLDAFAAGRGSSLSYRVPTAEGDPIDVRLTVVDRGVVEVRTDETEARHGSGRVRTERCRKLDLVDGYFEAGDCAPA
jgi:hypothetical protein